jgi:hypothetical protein
MSYASNSLVEYLLRIDSSIVNDVEEHAYTSLHLAALFDHVEVSRQIPVIRNNPKVLIFLARPWPDRCY